MEQQPMSEVPGNEGPPEREDIWRQEVQARVRGYRTRRGRRIEGAFSMRFPFPGDEVLPSESDRPQQVQGASTLASIEEAVTLVVTSHLAPTEEVAEYAPAHLETQEEPNEPAEPQIVPQSPAPRPRTKRKVIAFPKPLVPVLQRSDLLPEQPRILEVPQEVAAYSTTPLLDGLLFPSHEAESKPTSADHIELPLQPASISQRVYAALMDYVMVLVGALLFAVVSFKLQPKITFDKPTLVTAAVLPVLLWAVYQYLLLVYAGETIGMRMAGIRLRSFNGEQPRARQRRNRALGVYFSTASLMMGVLWALVDVDRLGWHDRISRTYLCTLHGSAAGSIGAQQELAEQKRDANSQ